VEVMSDEACQVGQSRQSSARCSVHIGCCATSGGCSLPPIPPPSVSHLVSAAPGRSSCPASIALGGLRASGGASIRPALAEFLEFAPIRSSPSIPVHRDVAVQLPHEYCALQTGE